jgi:peptide/nickel transport system substrate-binding protein
MNTSEARTGGRLRLYGPGGVDHLDPAASYRGSAGPVITLFARQLFTYPPETNLSNWQAIDPIPDLAAGIPSTYNAGLGASHRCYIVHLRPGVFWDTTPPREVTADDVARGIKRLCAPILRSAALPYFTSTIRGMEQFRADYAATNPRTAADHAAFQNSHDIAGLLVIDDKTVVFELTRPALDFVNILALLCASPAPVEYDSIVPGSAEFPHQVRSNGPYRPVHWVPGKELRLARNPVWRQETDPSRQQVPDTIEIIRGEVSVDRTVHTIADGSADLPWGLVLAERQGGPPGPPDHGLGYALNPYLVFNLHGSRAGAAVHQPQVRQAISYTIDKAAIAEIFAGLGAVTRIAGSIIPPGNSAHQDIDPYATPGGRGDPEKGRALLVQAGYPDGLTLTAVYPETDLHTGIARSYAADLGKTGLTVRLVALDPDDYGELLRDPRRVRAQDWDICTAAWSPDWFHGNGRVFLQPMFSSGSSGNYGSYRDPVVDELISQALASVEEPARADAAWRQAEDRILADAAIVPILFQTPALPPLRGRRVHGAAVMPTLDYAFDLSSLRLG